MKAKQDIQHLIRMLGNPKHADLWQAVVGSLVEIGAPAVGPLIAALQDKVPAVREGAAAALGLIGDARAVEPLIAAIRDDDDSVRYSTALALGQIGDARAVQALIGALGDGDSQVRESARQALAQIGLPAVEAQVIARQQESGIVARLAVEALDVLGWKAGRDEFGAAYWAAKLRNPKHADLWQAVVGSLVEIGAPALGPLIAALQDRVPAVREGAAAALGLIGDARAVEPLIAAIRDDDDSVRYSTALALGQIGDARAVQALIGALGDGDSQVRESARQALAQVGLPDVEALVEPLIAALKGDDSGVRRAAARALGEIRDPRAVEPLIAALKDNRPVVRQAAAEALGEIGWKPDQGEDGAAYWAAKGEWERCIQIGAPAVKLLSAVLGQEDKEKVAAALARVGAPAVEPLLHLLWSESWEKRRIAAGTLVLLYHSGRLGESHRRLILAKRPIIMLQHEDRWAGASSDCSSGGHHVDRGIGVGFPV